jgi:hypothetical protein
VWQGFSGNNSGECVLVGRFAELADAERFVADLLPGFTTGDRFSADWQKLLTDAGVPFAPLEAPPRALVRAGRAVLMQTHMALEDDFPSLRMLLWKRGGRAVYNGIHEHDRVKLLAGLGFPDAAALEDAHVELLVDELGDFERRGNQLFGLLDANPLGEWAAKLEQLAGRHGGRFAAELVPLEDDQDQEEQIDWPRALATPPARGDVERLWAEFPSAERAAAFAAQLDRPTRAAGRYVVIESESIPPRVGYSVQRSRGVAHVLRGERIRLTVGLWKQARRDPDLDARALTAELQGQVRAFVAPDAPIELEELWNGAHGALETAQPAELAAALVGFAEARHLELSLHARPCDPIVETIGRIQADLALVLRPRR